MNKNTLAIIKPNQDLKLIAKVFINTSDFLEKIYNPQINRSLINAFSMNPQVLALSNHSIMNAQILAIAQPSEFLKILSGYFIQTTQSKESSLIPKKSISFTKAIN